MSLGAGNSRVQQVPLQHAKVRRIQHENDGGVFATLTLVNGTGVGERKLVQFIAFIADQMAFKVDGHFLIVLHKGDDFSHIAVENVLFVIVPELHHAVATAPGNALRFKFLGRIVQKLLQKSVQFDCTERPLVHRHEHLQIFDRAF